MLFAFAKAFHPKADETVKSPTMGPFKEDAAGGKIR
tara:strand:- start:539 stop:646 length:108 start_codon:yes stop_codon:yes gene_type:complete